MNLEEKTVTPEEGPSYQLPKVPGALDVTPQTPGLFTAKGPITKAPTKALNGWTHEEYAILQRISESVFCVFADDFSKIDPLNEGQTIKQYGREKWPWWLCEGTQPGPEGSEPVKTVVELEAVPVDDASALKPWEIGNMTFTSASHALPTEIAGSGMAAMIQEAPIKAVATPP